MLTMIRQNIDSLPQGATVEARLKFLARLFKGKSFDTSELANLMVKTWAAQGIEKQFSAQNMACNINRLNPDYMKLIGKRPNGNGIGRDLHVYRFV